MATNRMLYLGLLALSVTFYFASKIWFSWLLLVLVLALPILSLLCSLPVMLTCRLTVRAPDTVEQGENVSLRIGITAVRFLPLPEVRIRLNLRTRDQDKDLRFLSHLSRAGGLLALSTDHCGFIAPEFRRGWVYDALGLIRLPLRMPQTHPIAILPPPVQPDIMPRLESFFQQQMKPKPGSGFSEQHDHRAYRPGDPVKSIHWKLSLKSDTLVVREPLEPVRRKIILAVRTPRGIDERAETLGTFRYLCGWMLEHGVVFEAAWMEDGKLRQAPINTEEDLLSVLRNTCLVPEASADLPWPLPLHADLICPVGPERGGVA